MKAQAGAVPERVSDGDHAERGDPAREKEQPGHLRGRAVPLDESGEHHRAEKPGTGSQCSTSPLAGEVGTARRASCDRWGGPSLISAGSIAAAATEWRTPGSSAQRLRDRACSNDGTEPAT